MNFLTKAMCVGIFLSVTSLSTVANVCGSADGLSEGSKRSQAESISLLRLIVTPEKYEAKRVIVHGFIYRDFGQPVLYLSRDSRINGVTDESINIISQCELQEDDSILEVSDLPFEVSKQIDQHGYVFVYVRGIFLGRKAFGERMPRAGSIIYEVIEAQRRGVDLN